MRKLIISLSLGVFLAVPIFVFADHNTNHTIQQLQAQIQALQAQLQTFKGSAQVSSPVSPSASPLPTAAPSTGSVSATAGVGQAVGPTLPPILISDDDTSNDDIIQLNNLRIQSMAFPAGPSKYIAVINASHDFGVKCLKFRTQTSSGAPIPCPLAPALIYQIQVDNDTRLMLRNRGRATLSDFKVGDRINVYGFRDLNSGLIEALIIRNLDKPVLRQFIQLNNVEVISAPSSPTPPATLVVRHKGVSPCWDFGAGAETRSSTVFPCPLGVQDAEEEVVAPSDSVEPGGSGTGVTPPEHRQRIYKIEVTGNTKILDRHRNQIQLGEIGLGDTLNIHGFYSDIIGSQIIATVIRDLSKPANENKATLQVVVTDASNSCILSEGFLSTRLVPPIPCGMLYDATVELYEDTPAGSKFIGKRTTGHGSAIFENLRLGDYIAIASAPGYLNGKQSLSLGQAGTVHTYTIALQKEVTAIPTIQVLSPNGGEKMETGKSYEIKYYVKNPPIGSKFVKLWLLEVISSASLKELATADILEYSSDYTWLWSIPVVTTPSQYKIVAELYKGTPGNESLISRDESDAPFSIVGATDQLSLIYFTVAPRPSFYPNAYSVSWALNNPSASPVTLTVSCAPGLTINSIDDANRLIPFQCGDLDRRVAYGQGSEDLSFTNASANSVNVNINLSPSGINTITRTITIPSSSTSQPSITVLSPNGGEVWEVGTKQLIKWSAPSSIAKVIIGLSTWSPPCEKSPCSLSPVALYNIANYVPNTGIYTWVVGASDGVLPNIPNGKYIITIGDIKGIGDPAAAGDDSDGPFSIVAVGVNLPPVISGVKGPTALKVGEIGTWGVSANDPENGPLSYSVIWGDEEGVPTPPPIPLSTAQIKQTTTFTHSYAKVGIYTPIFTVTDAQSLSAKTSISVNVGDVTSVPTVTVISPNGGEKFEAGKSYEIKYYVKNPPAGGKFAKLWLLEVVSSANLQGLAVFDILEYSSDYTWLWSIPADVAPSQYKILAELYKGTPGNESLISRDESDTPFSIVDPSVTQPVFQKISIPSTTLFTGSNIVYRFSATAGPDGDKTIKTLEFPYTASNLTFGDFKVGVYADASFTQEVLVPSSVIRDDGKLIWTSSVVIPAGTKRYFELRLQITNQTSSSVLSIALSGQTYNTLIGSGGTAMMNTPNELASALMAIQKQLEEIAIKIKTFQR